jgi:UDP-3-O-[3-hydroxymyristoyl] glucosamine N-acyltransferase
VKLPRPYPLAELAELLQCKHTGPEGHVVTGINEIHRVTTGDLVFVDHPKYYDKALQSAATTILIDKAVEPPEGKGLLISEAPFRDFNKLTRLFSPDTTWNQQIDPTATIAKSAIIRPGAVIGPNVKIGENSVIHSNVVIYENCEIGNNVIIHAGAVIGADAFYYKKQEGNYHKMHTCGKVVIEDHVEIGAQSCIDRGVSADTRIGAGTKIDNLVHVGHDTLVGRNCLFAAQVGVAGCVVIEDNVTIWGQAGLASDLRIRKGAVILAQSGLMNGVEEGKTVFGTPAMEARTKFREIAMIRKLDQIIKKLGV